MAHWRAPTWGGEQGVGEGMEVLQQQTTGDGAPATTAPATQSYLGRRGRIVLAAALAVLVVAMAGGLIVTWSSLRDHQADDRARTEALAAARSYAVDLASYDYHNLDRQFSVVLAHATPAFAKSFTQTSFQLRSLLTKYSATAKATVLAAGLESASTSRAVAVVFLNQTVTNTTQKPGTTTVHTRLQMTLVHTSGQWSIDRVDLF
jgi:Mce-associated membrane protein